MLLGLNLKNEMKDELEEVPILNELQEIQFFMLSEPFETNHFLPIKKLSDNIVNKIRVEN